QPTRPIPEENAMALPRRRVGKTRLEVTTLGLGGAPMGGFRATISDAEAVALTDTAYELGVRYFDTSPFYGYGRSELRMGAALRERPRESYVLSTKVGRVLHPLKPGEKPPADFRENGLPGFAPVFDYSYDGVMRSLEHSHLRLGLAKIDIARKIEAVCKRHGVELGAAAMQFPLFHPALCAVIPGALSATEVKQNAGRLSAKIPTELWSELKREKLLDPAAPTPN